MRLQRKYQTQQKLYLILRLKKKSNLKKKPSYYFGLITKYLNLKGEKRWFNYGKGGSFSCTIVMPKSSNFYWKAIRWAKQRNWVKSIEIRQITKTTHSEIWRRES